MPRISFCFSGIVQDVDLQKVLDPISGKEVDVSVIPSNVLIEKLKSGKLKINIADAFRDAREVECEVSDIARV